MPAVVEITVDQLVGEGVAPDVAAEFLVLRKRKRKRAPLTPVALKGIKAEAAKLGWSLDKALRECITRGWATLKADWDSVAPSRMQQLAPHTARRTGLTLAQQLAPMIAAGSAALSLDFDLPFAERVDDRKERP